MTWKSDIITVSHAPKDVEHLTEKADVLLWQHHLDEHFSGSCNEQSNFLGIMIFFLSTHDICTKKSCVLEIDSVRNGFKLLRCC